MSDSGARPLLQPSGARLRPDSPKMGTAAKCCCGPLPRMTAREHYTLSPWMKWRLKRRFPWKLCLHLILLVLTTLHPKFLNTEDSEYYRACRRNWGKFFLPKQPGGSQSSGDHIAYLYTVNETVDAIEGIAYQ